MSFGDMDLLLTVDTGFNGDLLLAASAAVSIGLSSEAEFMKIDLGDGTTATLAETQCDVTRLGQRRLSGLWSHPIGDRTATTLSV